MMRLKFLIAVLSLFALAACAVARPGGAPVCPSSATTVIKDEAEAKLLYDPELMQNQLDITIPRGQHGLGKAVDLIRSAQGETRSPGFLLVSEGQPEKPGCPRGPYTLMGWHEYRLEDRGSAQSVNVGILNGNITEIRTYEFDFTGTISGTYGDKNTKAEDYRFTRGFYQLSGTYTFSRKDHPDYWSLVSVIDSDLDAQDYLPPMDILTGSPAKDLIEKYKKSTADGTL